MSLRISSPAGLASASSTLLLLGGLLVASGVGCGNSASHFPTLPPSDGSVLPTGPVIVPEAGDDSDTASDSTMSGTGTLVTSDGACGALMPRTLITQTQVASNAPAMTGGVIAPGTYQLSAWNKYTGAGGASGPTTSQQAALLEFDTTSFQHAEAGPATGGGVGGVSYSNGYWSTKDHSFSTDSKCGLLIGSDFTVTGADIHFLFVNEEWVYTHI